MPDSLPDVPQDVLAGIGDAVEGVAPDTTAEPINPPDPATPAAPEGSTEDAATEVSDSFTKLDPSTLPPEVRPFYDSMHADYTRKTQAVAPWRKLSEELGVDDPAAVRDAVDLYTRLQDPATLREFATELNTLLGATEQPTAASPAADEFGLDLEGDPALKTLAQRVDQLQQELERRDAQAQHEQMQWALLGEVNRQEAMLKEAHPEWGASDGDDISDEWQAIWNLSVAFNGDLTQAAKVVEAAQNSAVVRMLNSKQTVAHTEGLTPPAPAAVQTPLVVDGDDDPELKGATDRAREFLRGIVNNSE